jgi:coenzyme F420 hydrogenase subunit beta
MSFALLKETVLDPDLCARCGLCVAACPAAALEIVNLRPQWRAGVDESVCAACTLCVDLCPGSDPTTPRLEREHYGRERPAEARWFGLYRNAHTVAATDPVVFERSGSGGGTTVLLQTAMEICGVQRVLVAGRHPDRPWQAQPEWCKDPQKLPLYGQSTYQLSAYLQPLGEVLQSTTPSRVAIVGLACHVQAIRKLQRLDHVIGQRARDRIAFVIEIACSSSTLPEGTASFITEVMGIPLASVAAVRYRDGGYPGEFAVFTHDGGRQAMPVWRAIRHFKDFKTHRCLSCADWLSGVADISVFDADPDIFRSSQANDGAFLKQGTILVRTEIGDAILQAALDRGAIRQSAACVREAGNLGLTRKRNRRAAYERGEQPIPAGPVPGFTDDIVPVDDAALVAEPRRND